MLANMQPTKEQGGFLPLEGKCAEDLVHIKADDMINLSEMNQKMFGDGSDWSEGSSRAANFLCPAVYYQPLKRHWICSSLNVFPVLFTYGIK